MKTILIILVSMFVSHASAQLLEADILENQSVVLEEDRLLFLGHSTSFWEAGKTKDVTREVLAIAQEFQINTVATVAKHMAMDELLAPMHYFSQGEINHLVYSRAGQHDLKFPNLKNIYITGGNLGRCLCEGLRDVIRGVIDQPHFSEVNVYLIRDAVYDAYRPFSPMRREEVEGFVQRFLLPSFYCPLQNWELKPRVIAADTRLGLFYDDEFIADYDLEPKDQTPLEKLSKKINLRFIRSSDFKKILQLDRQ